MMRLDLLNPFQVGVACMPCPSAVFIVLHMICYIMQFVWIAWGSPVAGMVSRPICSTKQGPVHDLVTTRTSSIAIEHVHWKTWS